jgi:hypothetical protein
VSCEAAPRAPFDGLPVPEVPRGRGALQTVSESIT